MDSLPHPLTPTPTPTPPPRRKRSPRGSRTAPSTPVMAARNPATSPDRPKALSLDARPGRRVTSIPAPLQIPDTLDDGGRGGGGSGERPKSAEPRRGSATNDFLQKPKVPRRNSIAGSIVSMLADMRPPSLADMKREVERRKKRARTRSSSLAGCEEEQAGAGAGKEVVPIASPGTVVSGTLTPAPAMHNIPQAVAMALDQSPSTPSKSTTPLEAPLQANNPFINVVDTSKEETSESHTPTEQTSPKEPDASTTPLSSMAPPNSTMAPNTSQAPFSPMAPVTGEVPASAMAPSTNKAMLIPKTSAAPKEPVSPMAPVTAKEGSPKAPISPKVPAVPKIPASPKATVSPKAPVSSRPASDEPDGACCSDFKMEQPSHVHLPELKEKHVTKLVVSFDDMDGPTKTSVYVSPTVSTSVSSANIDTSSVTNETLDIFECGICTENLSIPKSLPCLHNFCLQCLEKYFSANHIEDGQEFRCPTCRTRTRVPENGGAIRFPTNFHIENLRKRAERRRNRDVDGIVSDALTFLEQREIDIIDTLGERKRCTLADMGATRERFVDALDNYLEELQVTLEEKYHQDSTHTVQVIHKMRDKLEMLQNKLETDEGESDAVEKLRQQGELITSVAQELEEIKAKVNAEVDKVLRFHLKFQLGDSDSFRFSTQLGRLVSTQLDKDGKAIKTSYQEHTFVQWIHKWGMLLLGLLPALVFCYLVKLIANVGKKHG